VLACAAQPGRAGQTVHARIAVVKPAAVLDALLEWRRERADLEEKEKSARQTIAAAAKEIERIRAELEYFKVGSRGHEKRKAELAARREKLTRLRRRLSDELAARSRAALDRIQAAIRKAVRAYAVANGFDIVVDARAVVYVTDATDISLEVARQMNKRYKNRAEKKDEKSHEEE
jgi:Skp family chaperone for outer membrane proteins